MRPRHRVPGGVSDRYPGSGAVRRSRPPGCRRDTTESDRSSPCEEQPPRRACCHPERRTDRRGQAGPETVPSGCRGRLVHRQPAKVATPFTADFGLAAQARMARLGVVSVRVTGLVAVVTVNPPEAWTSTDGWVDSAVALTPLPGWMDKASLVAAPARFWIGPSKSIPQSRSTCCRWPSTWRARPERAHRNTVKRWCAGVSRRRWI